MRTSKPSHGHRIWPPNEHLVAGLGSGILLLCMGVVVLVAFRGVAHALHCLPCIMVAAVSPHPLRLGTMDLCLLCGLRFVHLVTTLFSPLARRVPRFRSQARSCACTACAFVPATRPFFISRCRWTAHSRASRWAFRVIRSWRLDSCGARRLVSGITASIAATRAHPGAVSRHFSSWHALARDRSSTRQSV